MTAGFHASVLFLMHLSCYCVFPVQTEGGGVCCENKGCENMVIFVWVIITQDLPLYFLLQILDKIVENPSNLICADCGMKGKT